MNHTNEIKEKTFKIKRLSKTGSSARANADEIKRLEDEIVESQRLFNEGPKL
jgi:hypothetical protein